jgi:hypothetical protein
MPLTIPKHLAAAIPRGVGNKEITAAAPFRGAALGVVRAISQILDETGWHVERTAVDAPAAPPAAGSRASESELGRLGLSSFRTPTVSAWTSIRQMCADHLRSGGSAATLPTPTKSGCSSASSSSHPSRAVSRRKSSRCIHSPSFERCYHRAQHKTTEQGYRDQLNAVAARTGWEPLKLESRLKLAVSGSRHDRLDAFMAAWVASLPPERRRAFGDAQRPDDAIWVPL